MMLAAGDAFDTRRGFAGVTQPLQTTAKPPHIL
jgi:hypothetical protein